MENSSANMSLVGEISSDNCRFREMQTDKGMSQDRFHQGLGGLNTAYEQISERILG